MNYKFKIGSRLSGDAEAVHDGLEDVRGANNGQLDAKSVVDAARKKRSPLHRYFEWDDTAAAEKYRVEQAGHLIRSVVTIIEGEEDKDPIRAYVNIIKDEDRYYGDTVEVMSKEESARQVLATILEELKTLKRKYARFQEFADVWAAIPGKVPKGAKKGRAA